MSMICKLAKIGDEVIMKMDPEARAAGRPGVPDGTRGVVTGHYRYQSFALPFGYDTKQYEKPGIWLKNGALIVTWADGSVTNEGGDVVMADETEYNRRYQELWVVPVIREKTKTYAQANRELEKWEWVGELPQTEFEVGDVVTAVSNDGKRETYRITSIDYAYLTPQGMRRCDGTEMPIYQSDALDENGKRMWGTSLHQKDSELQLVSRGNIWKHLNKQPLSFDSLEEEALFHSQMCWCEELRNPATNDYSWQLPAILEAVRNDTADGFYVSQILNFPKHYVVTRFENRDLGERVRAATMEGFGLVEATA